MNWTQTKRKFLKQIEVTKKENKHHIPYECFKNVPDTAQLREEDVSKRVWIASYPRTTKAFLKEIHEDHYKIDIKGQVPTLSLYKNEVILHPKEWTKPRFYDK